MAILKSQIDIFFSDSGKINMFGNEYYPFFCINPLYFFPFPPYMPFVDHFGSWVAAVGAFVGRDVLHVFVHMHMWVFIGSC